MTRYLLLIFFVLVPLLGNTEDTVIKNIRVSENELVTRIVLDATHDMPFTVFTLDDPPRLVIDVEAEKFKKSKLNATNLIKNYRVGSPEKGVFRIVFDLKNNANIEKSFTLEKNGKSSFRIVVDLTQNQITKKNVKQKKRSKKIFVVTIDPGHGGIDPGATNKIVKEKNLTLKSSKELKAIIENLGYKVVLTRDTDTYISLSKRRKIARNVNSDLFISIHVDAVPNNSTRGTSIYTLSERASDRLSARLAERENKVDIIAGVNLENVDNEVASILLDLTRRDTKNSSIVIAEEFIVQARSNGNRLLKRPHRQAGFAVLKLPDIPSVLVELGFLSNMKDSKLLQEEKYRKKLLESLAQVVDNYFKKREDSNY